MIDIKLGWLECEFNEFNLRLSHGLLLKEKKKMKFVCHFVYCPEMMLKFFSPSIIK